jgi:hypothetical protein
MKINKKKEYKKPEATPTMPRPKSFAVADFNLNAKIDDFFPEITTTKKKVADTPEQQITMNYLENAKKTTGQPVQVKDTLPKKVEKKEDDFNYLEVNFQMSKMIGRWDEYTKTYKMLYGDDIYDKMYVFPNYNYDYFDILDEKYEEAQAEMEIAENNISYDDLSDYFIFDKYDL